MIKVNGIKLAPTIFPDGTSQVWKLPEELAEATSLEVDWRFEAERELFDLFSLRMLHPLARLSLYMPFLPYARQDKAVGNGATFNLHTFARLIHELEPAEVQCLDAHNPKLARKLIPQLENIRVEHFQQLICDRVKAEAIVYPDEGALLRYGGAHTRPKMMRFEKTRDQSTGQIVGHALAAFSDQAKECTRFLIVDDICDGGATFISVAKALREIRPAAEISLFVIHGIFSRGEGPLLEAGITAYTTDSYQSKTTMALGPERVIKV